MKEAESELILIEKSLSAKHAQVITLHPPIFLCVSYFHSISWMRK